MPRTARILVKDGTYHVLTRGNNRQSVFHDRRDYRRYLNLLAESAQQYGLTIYHFALLPNHVHLVLKISEPRGLSKTMSSLNLSYALYYKRRYQYAGHLWQDRFKSLLIDKESYLLECGRYVELNPVRAGLVQKLSDYQWSSYHAYAHDIDNLIITKNPLYGTFGATSRERQTRYRQFLLDGLQRAKSMTERGLLRDVNTSALTDGIKSWLGLSDTRRPRGRPRKKIGTSATKGAQLAAKHEK